MSEALKQEQIQEPATSTEETVTEGKQDLETQSTTQEDTKTDQIKLEKNQTDKAEITKTEESSEDNVESSKDSSSSEETEESRLSDYGSMIQAYIDGELSEDDYKDIEKSGLNKEQFDIMAEGYKARQEKNTQELYSFVGGEETYQALTQFGAENLSEEEIQAYNSAINSNQPKLVKMAALGLKAMYEEENGRPPSERISGGGNSMESSAAFSSQQEVITALNDPRYGKDIDYTNTVNQRRAKSGY